MTITSHTTLKQPLAPKSYQQTLTHGVPLPHHSIAIKQPWREHLWGSPVVQWLPGSEVAFSQLGQHWQPTTKSLTMMCNLNPVNSKRQNCFIFSGQNVMPMLCLLQIPYPQTINLWSFKWKNYQQHTTVKQRFGMPRMTSAYHHVPPYVPEQPACQAHCKLQGLRWSRGLTFLILIAW